jgi:hypothetical protein
LLKVGWAMLEAARATPVRPQPDAQTRHAGQLLNVAAVLGGLLLFGIGGYRRLWHPDWSGGHALVTLWPLYLAGAAPILLRWMGWPRSPEAKQDVTAEAEADRAGDIAACPGGEVAAAHRAEARH